MILQGNEDLRVQKTILAINDAFAALVLECPLEAISIRLLCERAKINKKTFYRYYSGIHELLAETMERFNKGYLERVAGCSLPGDLAIINREFFRYAAEQGELYEKLVCHPDYLGSGKQMLARLVQETWKSSGVFASLDTDRQNLLVAFLHATGTELFRQWVADGKSLPLDEIIAVSEALLCRGLEGFVAGLHPAVVPENQS